ncbi:caspase, EACC1-associated type [Saccharothrix variisporea]|uniref:WD40 repeat protein n=1 Tax=Saccharothrix variisporea TaxID=543527 RepID=A0A495X647_9PSEU|nr:caspase family protein [Saccharothrix variisporea]RKT68524.1 WD40 repeat protein [Saccharothrix variisporea]
MGRRVALLIATYEYEDTGLRRLTTPAHDAEALAEVLADPSIAGFEVTTLVNEPLHRVGAAIGEFYRDRRRDDLTLLYFTGHGLKDDEGRLYLAMTNTHRDNLLFTGLPAEQVDQALENCASRQKVLVLDCCYSGAFPPGRLAKADTTVHTLERFQGRGRTVLTASDATQYSFEGDRPHGRATQSVFTRYLVEGLRDGSADLDGDGDITVDELYSYVHDRVVEEVPQQRPKKQDDVQGRTVIARNVNWTLPTHLANALASPLPADRRNALDGLAHLRRVGNDVVRARAEEEIHRLTEDDSQEVSTAATALLAGAPAAPPPAKPHPPRPAPPRAGSALRRALTSRRALIALVAAAALAVTAVLWLNRDQSPSNTSPEARVIAATAERLLLSPDAKTLAGFSTDAGERVHLWDLTTGQDIDTLDANTPVFSPDPNTIALSSGPGTAVLWDRTTHLARATLPGSNAGPRVAFTPDGKTLATAGTCACDPPFDNPVHLWNTEDGQEKAALTGHTNGVQDLSFSRDGRLLLTAAVDRTTRVWDVATGKNTATLDAGYTARFSPDSTLIAASSHFTEKISLWDTTGRRIRQLDTTGEPVSFSTDGKTLVTTGFDRKAVQLWEVATGKLVGTTTPDGPWAVSPDHRTVAVGAPDHSVLLVDARTTATQRTLTGHTARVTDLTYSADGRTLVSAAGDGTIRVWTVS